MIILNRSPENTVGLLVVVTRIFYYIFQFLPVSNWVEMVNTRCYCLLDSDEWELNRKEYRFNLAIHVVQNHFRKLFTAASRITPSQKKGNYGWMFWWKTAYKHRLSTYLLTQQNYVKWWPSHFEFYHTATISRLQLNFLVLFFIDPCRALSSCPQKRSLGYNSILFPSLLFILAFLVNSVPWHSFTFLSLPWELDYEQSLCFLIVRRERSEKNRPRESWPRESCCLGERRKERDYRQSLSVWPFTAEWFFWCSFQI